MKRSWVTRTSPPSNSARLSSSTSSAGISRSLVGSARMRRPAGVGWERAREHVEQRRLAAAVGADEADARARRDDEIEVGDETPATERLGHAARDQQPARAALRRREVDPRRPAGGAGPAVLQ